MSYAAQIKLLDSQTDTLTDRCTVYAIRSREQFARRQGWLIDILCVSCAVESKLSGRQKSKPRKDSKATLLAKAEANQAAIAAGQPQDGGPQVSSLDIHPYLRQMPHNANRRNTLQL